MDYSASLVSVGTNSLTINWGDAPANAYLLTVRVITGSDYTGRVDNVAQGTMLKGAVTNTTNFQPDVLEAFNCDLSADALPTAR